MGNAFLVGGSGGGSGLRNKPITLAEYNALSESDKKNPYVVWVITDAQASDLGGVSVSNVKTKVCVWSAYESLSVDDRLDPGVVWIISDKTPKDLAALGFGANEDQGSKLYQVTAEMDLSNIVKVVNQLVEKVNTLEEALAKVSAVLNADETS
jgi:hypothetical protein